MQHRDIMDQGPNTRYGDISFEDEQLRDVGYPDKSNYGAYDYSFPFSDQPFQPLYVNAKQLNWIKKRKSRRDILDTLMITNKRNYLHESRHKHAMKRLRAPSGRFLTKEETEELNRKNNIN
ncbi:CCAAT-binding factor subunit B [Encephalitozoon intestinalis ATCC 50506]|uniref:Transcriptional activator HAP2 n=1 Tax=Encephalitozoon intestinalis (strain ATCC 50506) TaxID=876142 RepID=E0S6F0_ENCIT|nr:CCAAT-binding factor subunit B [Encephalitozoon intestinalis ATCC 50506]ADM11285.1 CCAAT-binding factor subunit B [Encephalitozoon intestinalis ATCC 50506]UTX44953.1 CCAAT-binding factor subunit B [Encephalitozoon intestinalis]